MEQQGHLERIGNWLIIIGAAALAGIFATVIINGSWPEVLRPVQGLFAFLGDWLGDAALVVEGLLFLGPGLALKYFGLRRR